MSRAFVHTCVRVRDIDASLRFYEALGFERRGKLQFETAYNIYMGLPGDGDTLELTVNVGRQEPYDIAATSSANTAVTIARSREGEDMAGDRRSRNHRRHRGNP